MAAPVIVVRILCGTARGGSGWTSMTNEQQSHAGCGQQPEGLFSEPRAQRCLHFIQFHSKWRVEQLIRTFPRAQFVLSAAIRRERLRAPCLKMRVSRKQYAGWRREKRAAHRWWPACIPGGGFLLFPSIRPDEGVNGHRLSPSVD